MKWNKDNNQKEIQKRILLLGGNFIDTSMLKTYTFDIIVMYKGQSFIVEIKNPEGFHKKFSKLNEDEKKEYLLTRLTPNELKAKKRCEKANVKYHILYSMKCLYDMLGIPEPIAGY